MAKLTDPAILDALQSDKYVVKRKRDLISESEFVLTNSAVGILINTHGRPFIFTMSDLIADDWEVIEKKGGSNG